MGIRIVGGSGCIWALAGAVAGFLPAAWLLVPEIIERWSWAASGGRGERASWGEPLFYLLILGVPAALAGAAVGVLLSRVLTAIRDRAAGG